MLLVVAALAINQKREDGSQKVDKTAQEFKGDISKLGEENLKATSEGLGAVVDGSKDIEKLKSELYAQSEQISSMIGELYGRQAKDTFYAGWKAYVDGFIDYAQAAKRKDEAGMQQALQSVNDGYVDKLSVYLARLNPEITQITIKSGLAYHVGGTKRLVDYHVAGKTAQQKRELEAATVHINTVFKYISDSIAKQSPDKFESE